MDLCRQRNKNMTNKGIILHIPSVIYVFHFVLNSVQDVVQPSSVAHIRTLHKTLNEDTVPNRDQTSSSTGNVMMYIWHFLVQVGQVNNC